MTAITIQGPSVVAAADGSFTLTNYPVYALPDSVSLGESSGGPVCGSTAATECILYIGDNFNDFTKPHLWSAPFFISANGNDLGANPGDGTAASGRVRTGREHIDRGGGPGDGPCRRRQLVDGDGDAPRRFERARRRQDGHLDPGLHTDAVLDPHHRPVARHDR